MTEVMEKSPFIAEVTAYLGRDGDTTPLRFDGVVGNRARHVKSLQFYQRRLEKLLQANPLQGRESPQAWVQRVRSTSPRREDRELMGMVGRVYAIIERMDDEAELERRQNADAEHAKHKAMVDDLRRRASPSASDVSKLKKVIEDAAEGEQLLARMFAAFRAHESAQRARQSIANIFDGVVGARIHLQSLGETVPSGTIKRPTINDAPADAIEFARVVQQVIQLRRTN